ncbi:hypothetical protein COOONC_19134 [Cooperia oncophora]
MTDNKDIGWMYEGAKSLVNREDYLLGKKATIEPRRERVHTSKLFARFSPGAKTLTGAQTRADAQITQTAAAQTLVYARNAHSSAVKNALKASSREVDKNFEKYSDAVNEQKPDAFEALLHTRTVSKPQPSSTKTSALETYVVATEDPLVAVKRIYSKL